MPIQRAAAVAGPVGAGVDTLLLAGGLTPAGTSSAALSLVSVPSGSVTATGTLPQPIHDAAAATIGGTTFVFGGGSASGTTAQVVAVTMSPGAGAPALSARPVGEMPSPRADAGAIVIDNTAYIVGGYDGSAPATPVLSTTDGVNFRKIAALPVPVRYPALAAVGKVICAVGGIAVTGPFAGKPVADIQAIDTATGAAAVVGTMPVALEGASALAVSGTVYVAGGVTNDAAAVAKVKGPYSSVLNPEAAPYSGGESVLSTVWAYSPGMVTPRAAGQLRVPVAHAGTVALGDTAWMLGGTTVNGAVASSVEMMEPNAGFGYAGTAGAGSPYFGDHLLVADEGNNRLVLLDTHSNVTWQYPSASAPAPSNGFSADDAFFADHGSKIIFNEENNQVVGELAYPSGRLLWTYGHFGQTGSAPGYLNTPDDAYVLKNGLIVVADIANCRLVFLSPASNSVTSQIGTTGRCIHDKDAPVALGSPNGDTPLPNGNILVSEIDGGWIDEFTPAGGLVWTVQLPITYPSDPQRIGPNRYMVVDYTKPGAILEFNSQGQILYRYAPASGPGMLDHPSLGEMLPSGVFMLNDDHDNRMVAIDPATGALVWQYGASPSPGTGAGYLNQPDGFDVLGPGGTTPTHTATG